MKITVELVGVQKAIADIEAAVREVVKNFDLAAFLEKEGIEIETAEEEEEPSARSHDVKGETR